MLQRRGEKGTGKARGRHGARREGSRETNMHEKARGGTGRLEEVWEGLVRLIYISGRLTAVAGTGIVVGMGGGSNGKK